MGSWNATCALTRLPVLPGDPVVAFQAIEGPGYRSRLYGSRHALTFGLPFSGTYDSYGGVENLDNPALEQLHLKAFEQAGYYKSQALQGPSGGSTPRLLAAHFAPLWPLTSAVQSVFYSELGIGLAESHSDHPAHQALVLQAHSRAGKALKELSARLAQVEL